MNSNHSVSLIYVWRIAQIEAQHLNAEKIEQHHIAIALAKIVDVDLTELVPKTAKNRDTTLEELLRETRRIRTIFKQAGLNPKEFRQMLRRAEPVSSSYQESGRVIHRSASAKKIFSEAHKITKLVGHQEIYPVHLLLAVLLAEDNFVQCTLRNLAVKSKNLTGFARREIFQTSTNNPTLMDKNEVGRN